jgi:hypothetical protein
MRLEKEREEASRREAEKRERQQLVRAEVERLQEEKERRAKQLEYLRDKQEREDPLLSRAKAAEEEVDSALALLMKEMGDTGRPKEIAHQHGKLLTDRDEGFTGGGGGSRGKVRVASPIIPKGVLESSGSDVKRLVEYRAQRGLLAARLRVH